MASGGPSGRWYRLASFNNGTYSQTRLIFSALSRIDGNIKCRRHWRFKKGNDQTQSKCFHRFLLSLGAVITKSLEMSSISDVSVGSAKNNRFRIQQIFGRITYAKLNLCYFAERHSWNCKNRSCYIGNICVWCAHPGRSNKGIRWHLHLIMLCG